MKYIVALFLLICSLVRAETVLITTAPGSNSSLAYSVNIALSGPLTTKSDIIKACTNATQVVFLHSEYVVVDVYGLCISYSGKLLAKIECPVINSFIGRERGQCKVIKYE